MTALMDYQQQWIKRQILTIKVKLIPRSIVTPKMVGLTEPQTKSKVMDNF